MLTEPAPETFWRPVIAGAVPEPVNAARSNAVAIDFTSEVETLWKTAGLASKSTSFEMLKRLANFIGVATVAEMVGSLAVIAEPAARL